MILDKQTITEILNLKSSKLISESIANRQSEVIRKGFNFLNCDENSVLYVADEVGLGKTYIALGIASLLRHFSEHPGSYQDVIVVPKSNLQKKWEKEIKQFVANNYLFCDNRVKSITRKPVGEIQVIEKLQPITNDHPAYHIYRNSQFSFGLVYQNKKDLKQTLLAQLNNHEAQAILYKALDLGYFISDNKSNLKKLYAYLLSMCNPAVELLIVDEGHNFKHGLGESDDDIVSDRNNVIARFMGLRRNSEADKKIFQDFPELKSLIIPKVKKLIILSATPKTNSLFELRNQLDCFLPLHILSGIKKESEIKEKLDKFVIRGNMEYAVGGQFYTRNLCRYEHRRGNVEKSVEAPALIVKDDEQALILGLLQYNTIKHLNAKHNASFEIGMLAGFETFVVDQEKKFLRNDNGSPTEPEVEYEEVRNSKVKVSQDHHIVKNIIESYKFKFGCYPPHPKQDAIVEAAFQLMLTGEKSLIFVRRVKSADELERRLLRKFEDVVADELRSHWNKKIPSKETKSLTLSYNEVKTNAELAKCIDDIFNKIIVKILAGKGSYSLDFLGSIPRPHELVFKEGLYFLYLNYPEIDRGEELYDMFCKHCNLQSIKTDLVNLSYELLAKTAGDWMNPETDESEPDKIDDSYFFNSYFRQPHVKQFKARLYSTDWFDMNFYLLNQHFKIASFNKLSVLETLKHSKSQNNITEAQEIFIKNILEAEYSEHFNFEEKPSTLVEKNTLITSIIIIGCDEEFKYFLKELGEKTKAQIFQEIKTLVTIITSCLRNGSGFLPLFMADKADGDFIENYHSIIAKEDSVFHLILKEIRSIIKNYQLLRAVNFPDGESHEVIKSKLLYQTPVLGLTGQSSRNKSNMATQFRMPGFPYVLVTTDIFREGEDLHAFCQNIYHYGIAWNCSDMEQRTGRIDRINSMSHRKLSTHDSILFDNQVHVFYPYLQNTLEVNQVDKLFRSINRFIETFNDFTDVIREDGTAATGEAVSAMQNVIEKQLQSKYEHHYFKGCTDIGHPMKFNDCLGLQAEKLSAFLKSLLISVQHPFTFYFDPQLDLDTFSIYGDIKLTARDDRRGPFRILIKNHTCPGEFLMEVSSYLFKISTKVQKILNEKLTMQDVEYRLGSIDEFYALSFRIEMNDYEELVFITKLLALVNRADEIEEEIMKEVDAAIFN